MKKMLSLTSNDPSNKGKKVLLNIDFISDVDSHGEGATVTMSNGNFYWVVESVDTIHKDIKFYEEINRNEQLQ